MRDFPSRYAIQRLFMRYNRDRARGRLLVVVAPTAAPYRLRKPRPVGSFRHPTPEDDYRRDEQSGPSKTDGAGGPRKIAAPHETRRTHIRHNHRDANSLAVRGSGQDTSGRELAILFRGRQILSGREAPNCRAAAKRRTEFQKRSEWKQGVLSSVPRCSVSVSGWQCSPRVRPECARL